VNNKDFILGNKKKKMVPKHDIPGNKDPKEPADPDAVEAGPPITAREAEQIATVAYEKAEKEAREKVREKRI
jgi:hypothetical protein